MNKVWHPTKSHIRAMHQVQMVLLLCCGMLAASGSRTASAQITPVEYFDYDVSVCHLVTFEGGGHLEQINATNGGLIDGTPIRFPPEYQWRTFDTTMTPFIANHPSGTSVAYWTGPNDVEVRLEFPVAGFSFSYASDVDFEVSALDEAGQSLVRTTAQPNRQPDGFTLWELVQLELEDNLISRVQIFGGANLMLVDDFTACIFTLRTVGIDVKPGNADDIDPLNLKSQGALPVAIFSAAEFDATTIDETTLELGDPVLVPRAHVVGSAYNEDVNQDGLADLVAHFSASELVDDGAIDANTTSVILTGSTLSGEAIEGSDQVRIVGGGGNN